MVIDGTIMYQEKGTEVGNNIPEIYRAYELVLKIHHPFVMGVLSPLLLTAATDGDICLF